VAAVGQIITEIWGVKDGLGFALTKVCHGFAAPIRKPVTHRHVSWVLIVNP